MKKQAKYLATGMSAVFGIFLLAQCTSDRTSNQMVDKAEDVEKEAKQEYAEAKHEAKETFDDGKSATHPHHSKSMDGNKDTYPGDHNQTVKADFAEVNQEFKEAFEALGRNIEQDFDHTQKKMAVNRLKRISRRLDKKLERLEVRLDEENMKIEAINELAQIKDVQERLDLQIAEVETATHENWDDVRKDTRETCKDSNEEIAEQVDEIQEILADSK